MTIGWATRSFTKVLYKDYGTCTVRHKHCVALEVGQNMEVEITWGIKCKIWPSFKVHTCPIFRVIDMHNIVGICLFHKTMVNWDRWQSYKGGQLCSLYRKTPWNKIGQLCSLYRKTPRNKSDQLCSLYRKTPWSESDQLCSLYRKTEWNKIGQLCSLYRKTPWSKIGQLCSLYRKTPWNKYEIYFVNRKEKLLLHITSRTPHTTTEATKTWTIHTSTSQNVTFNTRGLFSKAANYNELDYEVWTPSLRLLDSEGSFQSWGGDLDINSWLHVCEPLILSQSPSLCFPSYTVQKAVSRISLCN